VSSVVRDTVRLAFTLDWLEFIALAVDGIRPMAFESRVDYFHFLFRGRGYAMALLCSNFRVKTSASISA